MATSKPSLRRRTLRPTNPPTLVEGVMTCSDSRDYITLEIAGGPPYVTATVLIAGAERHRVALDGCGTGSVRLPATSDHSCVEIAVEDIVLLTGRLPALPGVVGSV